MFFDFVFSFFVIIVIIMMVIIIVLSSVRTFESYTGECLCTTAPMRRAVVLNDSVDDRYEQKQIVLRFIIKPSKLSFFFSLYLSSVNHGLASKRNHWVNVSFLCHQSEMWADSRLLCVSADSINRYRTKMLVSCTEKCEPREGCAGP